MKIIDTHGHVLSTSYNDDLEKVINETKKNNMVVFNISFDLDSSKETLNLFKKHNNLIPVIGIHPLDSKGYKKEWISELEELINDDVAAIGEIGLDYHYEEYNKETQFQVFNDQIILAAKYNLPVVVHTRDSLEDCYDVIKNYPNQKFLLHSWSGDIDLTKKFLEISDNIYFSFNGIITFKNALLQKEVIKILPIDKIMFETDCPYLSPTPFRGEVNVPLRTKNVIEYVAEHLKMSFEDLNNFNTKNALEFFNVKKELIHGS